MTVLVDLQNSCGFKGLPNIEDLQRWIEVALKDEENQAVSVVVRVVDAAESAALNADFRQKTGPTNVLSFPDELPAFMAKIPEIKEQPKHLGDLIICEPLVTEEARQQNKSIEQHWAHLIVHGTLHLQGYDHIEDDEAEIMEGLEINILKQLGVNNPY
jgi:probable rRNA maturation factor